MIILNPPTRRKKRKSKSASRRKSTMRTRRRRTRRNPVRRYKSGPKQGQFMPGRKKKSAKRKSRKRRSTKRRSTARKSPSRKRRRRRYSKPRGRLTRPRLYRTGNKKRLRRGRRSKVATGTIINPFKIPSMKQIQGVFRDGAYGLAGYVGVNAVVFALDKYILGGIKGKQGPAVATVIDIVERVFAIGVTTYVGGKIFKGGNARRLMAVGGAVNVVMSSLKAANAQFNFLPEQAAPLLNGYEYLDGDYLGDYVTMGDYVEQLPGGAGSTATGSFSALASSPQAGVPLI